MSLSFPISGSLWKHKQYNNFRIKVTSVNGSGEIFSSCVQSGAPITPIYINAFYKYWSEDLLPYSIHTPVEINVAAPTPYYELVTSNINDVPSLKRKRV